MSENHIFLIIIYKSTTLLKLFHPFFTFFNNLNYKIRQNKHITALLSIQFEINNKYMSWMDIFALTWQVMLGWRDGSSSLLILCCSWRQQTLCSWQWGMDAHLLFYMAFILSFCEVDAWINSACQVTNQLLGSASFTLSLPPLSLILHSAVFLCVFFVIFNQIHVFVC